MTSNTRPDNFPVRHYRPDVAFPIELEQEGWHFSSGVNTAGDVRGLALSGSHVGICAETVNDALIAELENYGGCGSLQWLFVDTGAFSEVVFGPTGITVVKPICDADWMRIFALHQWAAQTYGRRALCVAPDQVGNQLVTLERLERYAAQVAAVAALGANIIVPVQKGTLSMSEMFARAIEILGLRELPIAGIPMKKDATSLADLAELLQSLPWFGARIHLLGIGPESKNYRPAIDLIRSIRPNCKITSDSVTLRRLVGRTNGRGNGPRALTAAQDRARANGATASFDVKSQALIELGLKGLDRTHERAAAMGWVDVELMDDGTDALDDLYCDALAAVKAGGVEGARTWYRTHRDNVAACRELRRALTVMGHHDEAAKLDAHNKAAV